MNLLQYWILEGQLFVKSFLILTKRDVNDLPPEFESTTYTATIYEETTHRFQPILKVS